MGDEVEVAETFNKVYDLATLVFNLTLPYSCFTIPFVFKVVVVEVYGVVVVNKVVEAFKALLGMLDVLVFVDAKVYVHVFRVDIDKNVHATDLTSLIQNERSSFS